MDHRFLRALYAFEFLLALVAVYTVWSQVGGQGHLDQMDWRWKLALGVGIAYSAVKATGAAVSGDRAWNVASLRWLSMVLALSAAAAFVTYYYHQYEPLEEEESIAEEEEPVVHRMAVTEPAAASPYLAGPGCRSCEVHARRWSVRPGAVRPAWFGRVLYRLP